MKAKLTCLNYRGVPVASFELDSPVAIIGRGPREVLGLPEITEKVTRGEPFHARLENTLYIGIPSSVHLARNHFSIRRETGESCQAEFFIQDLESLGGIRVNGLHNRGSEEMQLSDGDTIDAGCKFVFSLVESEDASVERGVADENKK
jgi:hypothetical protein